MLRIAIPGSSKTFFITAELQFLFKGKISISRKDSLTGFGNAQEIGISELEDAMHAHLERHPDLVNFMSSGNLALIRIKVEEYQVVRGIDDVTWWPVEDSY